MKEIGRTIAKFIYYTTITILLLWTASLTVTFIDKALPNVPWYVPYFGLVIFDGGMIAWLLVFLRIAEGMIQRATALSITFVNFLGVGLMVIAEILLGGQTLTAAPEELGGWAIWGIGVWTVLNVGAALLFHFGDPEAQKAMTIQNEKDAIYSQALSNLAQRRTAQAQQLAAQLGGRMYKELLDELFVDLDGDGRPDLLQSQNVPPSRNGHPPTIPSDHPGPEEMRNDMFGDDDSWMDELDGAEHDLTDEEWDTIEDEFHPGAPQPSRGLSTREWLEEYLARRNAAEKQNRISDRQSQLDEIRKQLLEDNGRPPQPPHTGEGL